MSTEPKRPFRLSGKQVRLFRLQRDVYPIAVRLRYEIQDDKDYVICDAYAHIERAIQLLRHAVQL